MTLPTSRAASIADAVVSAIRTAGDYDLGIAFTLARRELPLETLVEFEKNTLVISVIPEDLDCEIIGTTTGDQLDYTLNVVFQQVISEDAKDGYTDTLRAFIEATAATLRTSTMDDAVCTHWTCGRDPDALYLEREFFGYIMLTYRAID